jgi:predicted GNAT family acetyltransferase
MDYAIRDNPSAGRFETVVDGQLAVLDYRLDGDRLVLTHAGVPPPIEGRGIAAALARTALLAARERGLGVVARCSYVAAYLRRHPEFADLQR